MTPEENISYRGKLSDRIHIMVYQYLAAYRGPLLVRHSWLRLVDIPFLENKYENREFKKCDFSEIGVLPEKTFFKSLN